MLLQKTFYTAATFSAALLFSASTLAAPSTKGVITSVDTLNSIINVEARSGQQKSFALNPQSRVIIEGAAAGINDLRAGHTVKISTAKAPQAPQAPIINGEIIAINHDNSTAKIKDSKTRKVVTVSLASSVNVLGEVNTVAALTKGHLVTVRLK